MTKKVYLCKGGGLCTCKSSHRPDICEERVRTGKMIQEKGKEYYLYHGNHNVERDNLEKELLINITGTDRDWKEDAGRQK